MQIKSKKRVTDHGEVYTNEREVKAMIDLVSDEANRIESRFLEPACGDGNFLIEVLSRKLAVVKRRYKKNQSDYEKYTFVTLSSLYGIDLQEDNIISCQERLMVKTITEYNQLYKEKVSLEIIDAIRYVLSKNIVCGNALTMKYKTGNPLIIPEWSMISDTMVKRRDYVFEELMQEPETCSPISEEQISLLDMGEAIKRLPKSAFIPRPIREFPPTHYRKVPEEHELYENKA